MFWLIIIDKKKSHLHTHIVTNQQNKRDSRAKNHFDSEIDESKNHSFTFLFDYSKMKFSSDYFI